VERIPKLAAERLKAISVPPGDHPGPEMLAAFAEKALTERERSQVIQHLAVCTECRQVVVLAQPELLPATAPGWRKSVWLASAALRWGTAVAFVVIVGAVVMLREPRTAEFSTRSAVTEPRSVNEPASAPGTTTAPGSPEPSKPSSEDSSNGSVAKLIAPGQRPSSLKKDSSAGTIVLRKDTLAAGSRSAAPALPSPVQEKSGEPIGTEVSESVAVNGVPEPQPAQTKVDSFESRSAADGAVGAIAGGRAKPPLAARSSAQAASSSAGPQAMSNALVASKKADQSALFNAAAFPLPRFTIASDGALVRSLDSGKTWQRLPVGGDNVFRAVSANSFDLWVGGAAGALYHSSDGGQTFSRVIPSFGGMKLTADIASVEFVDSHRGKVVTTAGEVWSTSDAGQTWEKQ
jgi:hypothetical protein